MFSIVRLSKRLAQSSSFFSSSSSTDFDLLIENAKKVLTDKILILSNVSPEDYRRKLPMFYNASIGEHMRHSLDHYCEVLVTAVEKNMKIVNYDIRNRNTDVSSSSVDALMLVEKLKTNLEVLHVIGDDDGLHQPLYVKFMGDAGRFYSTQSTILREIAFVSHHSTHHLSTIKLMMDFLSYKIGDSIGKANSTVHAAPLLNRVFNTEAGADIPQATSSSSSTNATMHNEFSLGERKVVKDDDDNYWVAPNASLIGSVVLKKNASVWWNATIRADTEMITIGENSQVQDGCKYYSLCIIHSSNRIYFINYSLFLFIFRCSSCRSWVSLDFGIRGECRP